MKIKNILLILVILTICILSGCTNKATDTSKKDSQVTKIEQLTDTKVNDKNNNVNEEVKPDVPKEIVVAEAPKPSTTPAATETKPSSATTTKAPEPTPTPTIVVEKKSGIADINDAWRIKYFRLDENHYTGDKLPVFDDITLKIATGELSKAAAETQIKALGTWKESKTNKDCMIFRVSINTYTTASNDVKTILIEVNNKGLFTGDTYSNSYMYYDAALKQNRIVMIGIAMPSNF